MSAATTVDAAAPAPKGKKKLLIIVGAVLAVVLAGGGAAVVMMKKSAAAAEAAEAEESEDGAEAAKPTKAGKSAPKRDPKAVPIFVPLEPFTVNLADRNADRYAQLAVTLEVDDPQLDAQIKLFMPAIRNNVLLAIADRSADELMARDGKEKLARKIMKETSRALGYEVPEEEAPAAATEGEENPPKKKKTKKPAVVDLPIRAVHFSNFIIQ
jgi:flagellar protein FliL